jgi:hypothetical protein
MIPHAILTSVVLTSFTCALLQAAPPSQEELRAWAEKKGKVLLEFDDQDQLVLVSGTEKGGGDGEPFTDADAAMLAQIPSITVFEWNNPRITAAGVESIGSMEQLEILTLWLGGGIDDFPAEAMMPLDNLKNLRKLDLKHSFSVKGDPVIQNFGTFPHLKRLVVDTVHSDAEVVEFVRKNPTITEVELHRTFMSNEDFAAFIEALPDLVFLELKPHRRADNIVGHAGLASLKNAENLRELRLSHSAWEPLAWEGGVQHLVHVPSLRVLGTNAAKEFAGSPLEKLAEARPDLYIVLGQEVHHKGEVLERRDVDWDTILPEVQWEGKNPGT